jgi:hypothetical protein
MQMLILIEEENMGVSIFYCFLAVIVVVFSLILVHICQTLVSISSPGKVDGLDYQEAKIILANYRIHRKRARNQRKCNKKTAT